MFCRPRTQSDRYGQSVTWALWLAVPVGATALAALLSGLVTVYRRWASRPLTTRRSIRAQREYLDALVIPASSPARPQAPRAVSEDSQNAVYKLPE